MYIFGQHGILSIVKHRDRPGMLMVRAVARDDLAHYFPQAKIRATPSVAADRADAYFAVWSILMDVQAQLAPS
jgi:hypothetical protein